MEKQDIKEIEKAMATKYKPIFEKMAGFETRFFWYSYTGEHFYFESKPMAQNIGGVRHYNIISIDFDKRTFNGFVQKSTIDLKLELDSEKG